MTDPTDDTDLATRVEALETWRERQTDLLDELLNGLSSAPDPDDRDDPGAGPDDELDIDALITWVHDTVCAMIARPLRGELVWCPLWWEHPEAVFRLEALRRAWTEFAAEPGAAMSIWIRDHLDPCLRELLSPLGTFADCRHHDRHRGATEHTPLPTLPVRAPR